MKKIIVDKLRVGGLDPSLLFIVSLAIFLVHNVAMAVYGPVWAFGDEMAHWDYVMKVGQGRVPQIDDPIERQLFFFHRNNYDTRLLGKVRVTPLPLKKSSQLGLAGYSYEAHHPPLTYLLLALPDKILAQMNVQLRGRLVALRLVCLAVAFLAFFLLWWGLKALDLPQAFFFPLTLLPLLSQDFYFSVNTDVFVFLFTSAALLSLIRLFQNPERSSSWALLAVATVLACWSKSTALPLFLLWGLAFLWILLGHGGSSWINGVFWGFGALLLSSPWYIYNGLRFGHPFIGNPPLPLPLVPPAGFSLDSLWAFISSFFITFLRGEYIWNGLYVNPFSQGLFNRLFLIYLPTVLFFSSLVVFLFKGNPSSHFPEEARKKNLEKFLIAGAFLTLSVFLLGFLFLGGPPYYHARFSFGFAYLFIFALSKGWAILSNCEKRPRFFLMLYAILAFLNGIMAYRKLSPLVFAVFMPQ